MLVGQLTHYTKPSSAAGTAAKDEPGPTSGFGRQRGDRREQLITDTPERKYIN